MPVQCTFGGTERSTLFVTAAGTLFQVRRA
jgi:sugar lactone lactonase YvrE